MLEDLVKKINTSSRLKIIILILLMLMFGHSLWFFMLILVLTAIILLVYSIDIKIYIKSLKSILLWLIIIILIDIIIIGCSINAISAICKFLIIVILNINLINSVTFDELNSGFNKLFNKLSRIGIDVKKVSFDSAVIMFYIKYLIESKENILNKQMLHGKVKYGIKGNLIPRLLFATDKIENLKLFLREESYKVKHEKVNYQSKILEFFFVILLIIVLVKEVIV